jgi:hypothetical protein
LLTPPKTRGEAGRLEKIVGPLRLAAFETATLRIER